MAQKWPWLQLLISLMALNALAASSLVRSVVPVGWNGLSPSARLPAPVGLASQREAQVKDWNLTEM